MKELKTVSFSGELLLKMKADGVSEKGLAALRERAEDYMNQPTLCVTDRMMRAITGNPHDYASIGTYWWPNPDTPDGLPYVRRDGETTPAALDKVTYRELTKRVFYLALAAFYFDSEEYGRAAEKYLYDWHLNPETYMTPHAEYSQAIPGICNGRGIGVIDFSMSSYEVFDAVAILQYLGCISEENVAGLKKWYTDFTDWMLTSENGLTEDTELNNHGTYFDVHMLSAAIFTEREALIKKICDTAYYRRFTLQIEPDGKQPLELARTRALLYSASNTKALMLIANMAARCGYTNYISRDERYGDNAIKKCIDFIYPYYVSPETFPYQEMKFDFPAVIIALLTWADEHFSGMGYKEKALGIAADDLTLPLFPFV